MSQAVLESLYSEELYQIPSKIVFVISQPWPELSEADQTTLTKMVGALKLSMASVQIIHRKTFTVQSLKALSPSKVIALGATLESPAKTYEHFTQEGMSLVIADALPTLDDIKKKNLWLALKQMFGI
jgi:hypothetical protein